MYQLICMYNIVLINNNAIHLPVVPAELTEVLNRFTSAGFRVIALAGRTLHEKFTAEQFRDCNR